MEANDHRRIARALRLCHFQDEAPGMAFWHPRGFLLYRLLEDAARRLLAKDGYQEVRTPQVMRMPIWAASGHWENFPEGMMRMEAEPSRQAALKPVSCPGHIQIVANQRLSYRELPLRLAEFGLVHRDEPSGSLHGLMRLRQFTQDDGHIFCAEDQILAEVSRFCASVVSFYRHFGFENVQVALASRPAERFGDDARWDQAEAVLAQGAEAAGLKWHLHEGEGAFYGPKLEFSLEDREGRSWQCGTIQLDFVMPDRFGLEYIDEEDQRRAPALLHRAVYGSLERFMGILLEHHAGRLPLWLSPEQIRVLPIGEDHQDYAHEVSKALVAAGLRASVDAGADRVGKRVAEAHEAAVPLVIVVGGRERDARSISVRLDNKSQSMSLADGLDHLVKLCAPPA